MTTSNPKSRSAPKTASKTEAPGNGAAVIETAAAGGEAVAQTWMDTWRRSMAMSEEMARFAMARAEHNMKMFHRLAGCGSPTEVMEVCTEALQTASDDYTVEIERVKETIEDAVSNP